MTLNGVMTVICGSWAFCSVLCTTPLNWSPCCGIDGAIIIIITIQLRFVDRRCAVNKRTRSRTVTRKGDYLALLMIAQKWSRHNRFAFSRLFSRHSLTLSIPQICINIHPDAVPPIYAESYHVATDKGPLQVPVYF